MCDLQRIQVALKLGCFLEELYYILYNFSCYHILPSVPARLDIIFENNSGERINCGRDGTESGTENPGYEKPGHTGIIRQRVHHVQRHQLIVRTDPTFLEWIAVTIIRIYRQSGKAQSKRHDR